RTALHVHGSAGIAVSWYSRLRAKREQQARVNAYVFGDRHDSGPEPCRVGADGLRRLDERDDSFTWTVTATDRIAGGVWGGGHRDQRWATAGTDVRKHGPRRFDDRDLVYLLLRIIL